MLLRIAVVLFALLALSDAKSSYGCSNRENKDNLRDLFLTFHNNARRRVAEGVERGARGKLGPARNMYELRWNCEMEKAAQKSIETCNGDVQAFGSWGANLITFRTTGTHFGPPKPIIDQTLKSWWEQGQKVGLGRDNKYFSSALYHFGNMVHSATSELGCAYKTCGNILQVLCLYDEIGHITGQILFERGKACEKNEDCTTYKNSRCNNGLCVKPEEAPDDGTSKICKERNGMTDKIRNRMLDMHNDYRSLVAKGQAEDKKGFAPPAARMHKLSYRCDLERLAVAHARKCVMEHSDDITRQGTGENLYSISIPRADKLKSGERACKSWFGELKEFGVGRKNVFDDELLKRVEKVNGKIGHYTQMVWGTTEYVGCGIHNCPDKTLVVCNYKKAGNMNGQSIYPKGDPCSRCPTAYLCTEDKLCTRD